ncbi:MAG: AraC family transcriptional regulator [Bacteroidales bacterium]|jgi:AraC-like DNA-binding protein|nr:AraC family transcriptional regulator [Bacteroidales bacterium]
MVLEEIGVCDTSVKYFCTPSEFAKNMFYYITRCGHYFCNRDYTFTWDSEHGRLPSRMTYLLFYIKSGSLTIKYGGRTQRATSRQVIFIDCRLPHEYWTNGDLEFLWLHLDGSNIGQFHDEIAKTRGTVFSVEKSDILYTLIETAITTSYSSSEIERSQLLYRILCELLIPTVSIAYKSDNMVARAMEYIGSHYMENINVSTVASHINISTSHLSRLFKQWTACPPYEFIILARITRAKQMLCTTSLSVKEIAYAVGYNSEVNFITSFTAKVGASPGNFRKGLG